MSQKALLSLMVLIVLVLVSGCGSQRSMHDSAMRARHDALPSTPSTQTQPPGPAVETLSVAIENFAFSPPVIEVRLGATVTWTNRDAAPHTVTFKNVSFNSGLLSQNESWSHRFTESGVYEYFCEPHPWMIGTVVVRKEE